MMKSKKVTKIESALQIYGGFVRYYDTTEPLPLLAALVSSGPCRDILACCGGGDQTLTMLGASPRIRALWAVDINPAQLFILAAKAQFLNKKRSAPFLPSFKQLKRLYPQKISPVKRDIRPMRQLYNTATGKLVVPPPGLSRQYAVVHDDEMFVQESSGPYWQKDPIFSARVRGGLPMLNFLQKDILESPEHFKAASLDIIYFSDIYWPGTTGYHMEKLCRLSKLLRPGGRVIGYKDPGDNFEGSGMSPVQLLAHQAKRFFLCVHQDPSGYLVLQRE